jgi:hypothetical protein
MSLAARAVSMWLVILIAMLGNGALRVTVFEPRWGEATARQVASILGVLLVLALSRAFVRRLERPARAQLLGVGVLWLALTVCFEFGMGRFVSHLSWEAMLADYNLLEGRLWPLVLLATLLGPRLGLSAGSASRGA